MIVLTGGAGRDIRAVMDERDDLGLLLSPRNWRGDQWFATAAHIPYACDNDVYGSWNRWRSGRTREMPADWWKRVGESQWLRMLDRIPATPRPMFCLLPDVVGDWEKTLATAYHYRPALASRQLPIALALQDGCDFQQALQLSPATVFIGGTTEWKWRTVEPAARFFHQHGIKVHVGRAGGRTRIRECLRVGVDSCDSTGFSRFWNKKMNWLPGELDGAYQQLYLF